jgi:uncharacterized protein with PIN domain
MTKLIADAMFGTLAKWLRVLGFDTVYAKDLEDEDIVALAKNEGRVLITRDKMLAQKTENSFYLDSHDLDDQLKLVLEKFPPVENQLLTRCLLCNSILSPVEKSEVKNVPDGVLQREEMFWRCEKCEKFYWPATHYENMVGKAKSLTREKDPGF